MKEEIKTPCASHVAWALAHAVSCARKPAVLATAFILLLAITPAAIAETVLYVDDDATGANDGSSWPNAYNHLQDALAHAKSAPKPVEIRVARGTYKPDEDAAHPDGTGDREATFQLINEVALKGAYGGLGAPNPDDRDVDLNKTVLSGDLRGNDGPDFANNKENSYHIFYHPEGTDLDNTAILDGFTITAANANSPYWLPDDGGGMYNRYSSPTINNCTFSRNTAKSAGGMYNYQSSPNVNNCTFSENFGGGMVNFQSSPPVNDCTFTANSAGTDGGGMENRQSSSPNVNNCTFILNSVGGSGAGMYNYLQSDPNVRNCTFSWNTAGSAGGGMSNFQSSPTVDNCTFSANEAGAGGGMSNGSSSNPTVNNCTFTANLADENGGGILNGGGSPTIDNCTFSANVAQGSGGGMSNSWSSSPTIDNCTFTENSAGNSGGGMRNYHSNATVDNCIFTANSAGSYGGGMSNQESSLPSKTADSLQTPPYTPEAGWTPTRAARASITVHSSRIPLRAAAALTTVTLTNSRTARSLATAHSAKTPLRTAAESTTTLVATQSSITQYSLGTRPPTPAAGCTAATTVPQP